MPWLGAWVLLGEHFKGYPCEYLCSRVDPSLLSSTKTTYPTISSDKLLDHYVTLVPEKGDGAVRMNQSHRGYRGGVAFVACGHT